MAKTMRERTRVVPSTAGVEIKIMSAWPTELQQLDLDQRGVLKSSLFDSSLTSLLFLHAGAVAAAGRDRGGDDGQFPCTAHGGRCE